MIYTDTKRHKGILNTTTTTYDILEKVKLWRQ